MYVRQRTLPLCVQLLLLWSRSTACARTLLDRNNFSSSSNGQVAAHRVTYYHKALVEAKPFDNQNALAEVCQKAHVILAASRFSGVHVYVPRTLSKVAPPGSGVSNVKVTVSLSASVVLTVSVSSFPTVTLMARLTIILGLALAEGEVYTLVQQINERHRLLFNCFNASGVNIFKIKADQYL